VGETSASYQIRSSIRSALDFSAPGDRVLVGVSGGADSLALAQGLILEAEEFAIQPIAIIIDHQLQKNSHEVASTTEKTLVGIGFTDVRIIKVKVDGRDGIEASARRARYSAFEEVARNLDATLFLLGHTKDDQAETVLMGLARGSGTRSLSGMAEKYGIFFRPLLAITRAQTIRACEEWKLSPWSDPHNDDLQFTRVRVRKNVLPTIERDLGPGIADALVRSAKLLRDDADALDEWSASLFSGMNPLDLDVVALESLPRAVRTRVLRLAIYAAGAPAGSLNAEHIAPVEAMVSAWRGQGECSLPGGVKVQRISGRLSLLRPTHN